jgi:hypothetical protein
VTNRNAPLVWDVTGGQGATGTGVKIQLWSSGGGTNQQWMPVPLGNGYYKFVVRNSGLCLDTPGASTAAGTQLQQWTCNGSAAQAFQIVGTTLRSPCPQQSPVAPKRNIFGAMVFCARQDGRLNHIEDLNRCTR